MCTVFAGAAGSCDPHCRIVSVHVCTVFVFVCPHTRQEIYAVAVRLCVAEVIKSAVRDMLFG